MLSSCIIYIVWLWPYIHSSNYYRWMLCFSEGDGTCLWICIIWGFRNNPFGHHWEAGQDFWDHLWSVILSRNAAFELFFNFLHFEGTSMDSVRFRASFSWLWLISQNHLSMSVILNWRWWLEFSGILRYNFCRNSITQYDFNCKMRHIIWNQIYMKDLKMILLELCIITLCLRNWHLFLFG